MDVFSSRSLSLGSSRCIDIPHAFHRSGVSAFSKPCDSPGWASDRSRIKLPQKNKRSMYQMNLVAAYHARKHLVLFSTALPMHSIAQHQALQRSWKWSARIPGLRYQSQLFVCLGGFLVFFFSLFWGFLVFAVYISRLPWQPADRVLSRGSRSVTPLLELAAGLSAGSHSEMRWMSHSVWFTCLLSWRLRGGTGGMLEGFW